MSIAAVAPLGPYAQQVSPYASQSGAISGASRTGDLPGLPDIDLLDPEVSRSSGIEGSLGFGRTLDPTASSPGFGEVLAGALRETVVAQTSAAAKAEALSRGENDDIHGTMISAKEADISLKLVGAVRNKLLDAFHELWRTNV